MATMLLAAGAKLFGSGGAAAAASSAASTAGAAATASSGISLAGILQGVATVGGLIASIDAGDADATQAELAASDAEQEQELEVLQGIDRRRSIRLAMRDAVGAAGSAYAASGVDLSFGSAAKAREDAFREADLALISDNSTQTGRIARLSERAANYRATAKRSRRLGLINGLAGAAQQGASFFKRG